VITVASACKALFGSCPAGQVNSFSSRGASVDVAAPGDQILSAQAPNSILAPLGQTLEGDYFGDSPTDDAQNRLNYMRLSGTSMATPHIAGVVALLLQANPDLTPAEVREILTSTATDMVVEGDAELVPGFDNASGYGIVNVRKALAKAVGAPLTESCPGSVPPPTTDPDPIAPPVVTPPAPSSLNDGRFGGSPGFGLVLLLAAALYRRLVRK
jgi:subtilisin family serine protease